MLQTQPKYNIKYDQKYPQSSTGKERDSETGFSYFGARYYDSDILTGWLSVDPLADKYPGLSPYAYCAWNPVKLVDPDGRDFDKIINHEDKTITICAQFACEGATEEQNAFIQKAANSWNSCNFTVSLPGKNGIEESYTVSFDINNGNGPKNGISFMPDDLYNVKYPKNRKSGGVSDGKNIAIRSSTTNNQILAHEMGHCFGIRDNEVRTDYLMFASNDGLVPIKMLSTFDFRDLLSSCGFKFRGINQASRTELCKETIVIGDTPEKFWNTVLRNKNFINNNTEKFVQ